MEKLPEFKTVLEIEQYFSKKKDDRLTAMAQIIGMAVSQISSTYMDAKHTGDWNWEQRRERILANTLEVSHQMNALWKEHYSSDLFYYQELISAEPKVENPEMEAQDVADELPF